MHLDGHGRRFAVAKLQSFSIWSRISRFRTSSLNRKAMPKWPIHIPRTALRDVRHSTNGHCSQLIV